MIEDWRYSDENLEKRSLCLLFCIQLDEEINTSIYEFCHYFTSNGLFGDLLPTDESPKTEELKKHGGDIVATAAKILPVRGEGAWMDPGPLGTLGVGMPFGLAAQLSHPEKRVVIVYGDGSFGLNGFEFDTAVRFGLPVIGIVGNDAAWGQMMRPQGAMMGWDRLDGTLLARTRYDKIVEAMGGYGKLVESPDEIRPALERAAASGKAACINIMIKQDRDFKGGIYV